MKLAVFGATGGLGREVVERALTEGHTVVAFVRPASSSALAARPGLEVVVGELDDEAAVRRTIAGVDAVISALGARSNTPDQPARFAAALAAITAAMRAEGVRRLVAVSGAALILPGETPTFGRRVLSTILHLVAKHVAAAKAAEADVIRACDDLAWTLVRPPRMTTAAATGRAKGSLVTPPSPAIPYADVAAYMVGLAGGDEHVHAAPFVGLS